MAKKNSFKKALITSALSLTLSCSMLVGTTFAWFTDSVTSSGNIIQTGTLNVGMYWAEGNQNPEAVTWTDASRGAIFNNTTWEPGRLEAKHIKIKNEGSLALKYKLVIVPNGEVSELADVIDVYYIDGATQLTSRELPENAKRVGTLRDLINDTDGAAYGYLLPKDATATDGTLEVVGEQTVTIALKMRESAGNEYQNLSIGTNFSVQLLATQYTYEEDSIDKDYDADASTDDAIFVHGGVYNMTANRDKGINVSAGAEVIINGNDKVIKDDGAGFQNSGDATVNDVELNAGNASSYSNITEGADAKTTYNNVTVNSKGGGIGAADGAEVIFNSGSVDVDSTSTSGRYLFYAEGEGTKITINGGNFDFNKTQNQKRAYICAINGATVYVTGGTFGKASSQNKVVYDSTGSKYSDGIIRNETGTVIITGGTFGFDPSNWVADGYEVVKTGGTWTVKPYEVSTADELKDALKNGGYIVLTDDVENDNPTDSNSYGKTGYNQTNGGVLDGNGYTMTVTGANGTWDSGINTTGGTIKNITVTGAFRGIFINHNSDHSEKVVLENVIIDGTTYTISCDQGTNQGLTATNCTFNGWTSYAATLGATEFINCNFGKGNGYAYCRPYANTTFTNCVFEEGYEFDASQCTSTFINCYVGETLITNENVVSLLGEEAANIIVQNG